VVVAAGAVVVVGAVVPEGATAIVELEKGGGGGNNAEHEWMLARNTNTIKHPSQGYKLKWYKLCGPGHSKGTPAGMYMQAPHDHVKWLLSKKESLANINAKKKSLKAKKI
jgi:hypothetical protein